MAVRKSAAPSKDTDSGVKIFIPTLEIGDFNVRIEGTSSLIVHRFSEKAKKMIEDKQQKTATAPRAKRDPKSEYLASLYVLPGHKAGEKGARYGVPAVAFKRACEAIAPYYGMPRTVVRGLFQIHSAEDGTGGLIPLKYKKLLMNEDAVRLESGVLDLRYRGEFLAWSCDLKVIYDKSRTNPTQICSLLSNAGFAAGICEKRPAAKKGGSGFNGMFKLAA